MTDLPVSSVQLDHPATYHFITCKYSPLSLCVHRRQKGPAKREKDCRRVAAHNARLAESTISTARVRTTYPLNMLLSQPLQQNHHLNNNQPNQPHEQQLLSPPKLNASPSHKIYSCSHEFCPDRDFIRHLVTKEKNDSEAIKKIRKTLRILLNELKTM